ncbi:oligosaccharide flippase family protein [Candidatus Chloroploca asiatica]|uniref:Uncharacterized protein n=1 Tax=Candidatus Chloroploca asiatica TaxID=1506545 RepID=A0A2H3KVU1_9CHLR|nr:oligosaccharide flippase family protein [Candidatus Chloroploca asiatica]PDV96461.1 hypothetical protein A9Q02_07130 [Candidatus Chloroploca asiatica]
MTEPQKQQNNQLSERRDLAQIILRNTLVITVASWGLKAANFFYLIAVVRLLGASGYGQYAAVIAFVGMFGVFFELGMTQYVERNLARDGGKIQEVLGDLMALRIILAVAAIVVLPIIAWSFGYHPDLVMGVVLYAGTFVLAALFMPLLSVLNAAERFDAVAAIQVRTQLMSIGVSLVVLWLGGGVLGLLSIGYLILPIQILMAIRLIRRLGLGSLRPIIHLTRWPTLLVAGIPFGLTSLALTFNFNADAVILSSLRSDSEVGWYSAVYGLVFKLVAVADGLLLTMTPSLAREHVNDPEQVQAWTSTTVGWLAFFGLPAAVGLSLLATPVTTTLFGTAFAPGGPALAILAWDIPLLLFTAFCGSAAVAIGLEWPAARIYLLGTILNIGLNLIFIPAYGIIAAAAITVITDGICALLFLGLLGKRMRLEALGSRILRIVLASVVMGVAVALGRDLPLPVAVIIGITSYGAMALGLRLVDQALINQGLERLRRLRTTTP